MNHRKNSRNKGKKTTNDDNLKSLGVRKLRKTNTPQQGTHGTSIYEIDIKSSVGFRLSEPADDVKLCIANVAPVALEKKSNGTGLDFSVVENPFIESYYPRFWETETESEGRAPTTGKPHRTTPPTAESQPSVKFHDFSKKQNPFHEKKKEAQSETTDPSPNTKKPVKQHIFEGFFTSGSYSDSEEALLHLHHHEHHHHYHFDHNTNDQNPQFSKPASNESRENLANGRKRFPRRRKTIEEETPKHTYFCTCENKSNTAMTRVVVNSEAEASPDADCSRGQKLSGSSKNFRSRASSSESVRHKKSYLLKTHNYSDTDLPKCDSEGNTSDTLWLDFLKRDSKTNFSSLVSSLRSANLTKATPQEPTDPKSPVKAVYIRCMYPPEVSDATVSCTEAETSSLAKKETEGAVQRDRGQQISDSVPLVIKRSTKGKSDVEPVQMWAEKIRVELKEIKKTLKIMENEFLKRKSLVCRDENEDKEKSEEELESGQEISVFSSRTFILRAENFYIIEESDSENTSDDFETISGNDELCYAETERGHFFLSPNGSWFHFKNDDTGKHHVWKATPMKTQ